MMGLLVRRIRAALLLFSMLHVNGFTSSANTALLRGGASVSSPPASAPSPLTDPPSLAEVEQNITRYLKTLHTALAEHQGFRANPVAIWETYFNVTSELPMRWDSENRLRVPRPRQDGSIFVSLGTYRGMFLLRVVLKYSSPW